MTQEQILEIISNYDRLNVLVKNKVEVIEPLDKIYNTSRGIEAGN